MLSLTSIQIALVMSFWLIKGQNYLICQVCACFIGFGDCLNQSIIMILMSAKYGSAVEPYAISKLLICCGIVVTLFVNGTLSVFGQELSLYFFLAFVQCCHVVINFVMA